MTQYLLETENLGKDYDVGSQVVRALQAVTVGISKGEFVAVMGPSGSGKSTFMNILGCLDTPSTGRYLLDGALVSSLSRQERAHIRNQRIGFVFQSFHLLARTSARENVALALRYAGIARPARARRATEVLTAVGLENRIHHHPSQLSGGQQQRVAIARALVNHPSLILADEPTGALDTWTSIEIMALFQNLNRNGMTIVIVTHEQEIAAFAKRRLRFRDGRLVENRIADKIEDAELLLQKRPSPEKMP